MIHNLIFRSLIGVKALLNVGLKPSAEQISSSGGLNFVVIKIFAETFASSNDLNFLCFIPETPFTASSVIYHDVYIPGLGSLNTT